MAVHVANGDEFLADSLERSFTIRLPVFATPISNSIVSADGYARKYIFLVDDPANSIVYDLSYMEKNSGKEFRTFSVMVVVSNDGRQEFSSCFQHCRTFFRFKLETFINRHECSTTCKRAAIYLVTIDQMPHPTECIVNFITFGHGNFIFWRIFFW